MSEPAVPALSIIVPVYNVIDYLPRCIDSILSQSCGDFELILVDDGSSDGSGEMCDDYAGRDPRIRVIHQENGGLSAARNSGLDIARGIYVSFADSDDYLLPGMTEAVLEAIDGQDLVNYGSRNRNLEGWEWKKDRVIGDYVLDTPKKRWDFLVNYILGGRTGWEVWSFAFRRELIEKYHLRFYDNRRIFAEDMYFVSCYAAHAVNVRCIPGEYYRYEKRPGSLSVTISLDDLSEKMTCCAHRVHDWYAQYEDCTYFVKHFAWIYCRVMSSETSRLHTLLDEEKREEIRKIFEGTGELSFMDEQTAELLRAERHGKLPAGSRHYILTAVNVLAFLGRRRSFLRFRIQAGLMDRIRDYRDAQRKRKRR